MTKQPRPPAGFIVANTLWFLAAMTAALVPLWPVYQSSPIVVLAVVALALGATIAIVGAVLRWPAWLLVLVSTAVFLLVGVPLAVPQETMAGVLPTLEGLRLLVAGVAFGWKQLLTITLPVGDYQALLVPALVLVLGVAVVSLSVALRSRIGSLAAFGPLIVLVVGIAFGAEYGMLPIFVSLTVFGVSLMWVMWRRWYARRAAIRLLVTAAAATDGQVVVPREHRLVDVRRVLIGILILAIAGGAGIAAATFLPPAGERQVLRTSIEQPFDPRDYSSPLAGFRRYLQDGTASTVLFRIDGLPTGARVRIATLDTYDGIVSSVGSEAIASESGSFTRVPFRFDQVGIDGEQLELEVEIGEYTGVWLPTVGQLEAVEFAGPRAPAMRDAFYYNNTAGTAAVIGGLEPGDRYSLEAVLPPLVAEAAVATATPGSAIVPAIRVLPAEIEPVLTRYVSGVDGAGARLVRMLERLRADGYVSHGIDEDEPPSRSGHAADRITELLTEQRMIGDAEQYAVTAALMARQLGFPSRVVFGFAPEITDGATTEVTGETVSAWIEVDTEQYGWVTLDPNPPVREIPEEEPEDPTVVARPQPIVPPASEDPTERFDILQQDAAQDEPVDLEPWLVVLLAVMRVAAWVALVAAVVLAPFLVVIAAKARRRHLREQASTPLARITSGWREYEDAVLDHGFEPAAASTRREVAATVGGAKAAVLAAIADRAVFAPAPTSADEADKVWRAVTELNAGLDVGLTRWQRAKARVSLRSFRGYSVPNLFKR